MNLEDLTPRGEVPVAFVHLVTSSWASNRGLHQQRSLMRLKRKSKGRDFLDEEAQMIGADLCIDMIKNLNECEDGIYQVVFCDESRDWETGAVDSYRFKLIPA